MTRSAIVLLLVLCAGSRLASAATFTISGGGMNGCAFSSAPAQFGPESSSALIADQSSGPCEFGSAAVSAIAGPGLVAGSVFNSYCGSGNSSLAGINSSITASFTIVDPVNETISVSLNLLVNGTLGGSPAGLFIINLDTSFGFGHYDLNHGSTGTIPIPPPGTAAAVTTPTISLPTNTPLTLNISLESTAGAGFDCGSTVNTNYAFSFPSIGPVFNLPPGVTVNAPELNIVNNRWSDPRVGVAPSSVSFGMVNVGTFQGQVVTVTNRQPFNQPLVLQSCSLDSPANGFSSSTSVGLPVSISAGATFDINVGFMPTVAGAASNTLHIVTSASPVDVPMSGTGVNSSPPPLQQISDILAFYDDAVQHGTLIGTGPGQSATGRLGALRNMIKAAGDLIQQGKIGEACQQLKDAINRTDGNPTPPDFVTGSAAPQLMQKLQSVRTTLGCA